ncbi:hypothetical protein VP01_1863g3 [Puccinia sorghi]|uniref:Uncharacterized protein n=1 Tax=Puccinia sorghi TaxID=27349 RepID=A0A0L6VDH8_9BASI|nr:hypothetical protein VP01_1863g3 [Puccinia sorghi]
MAGVTTEASWEFLHKPTTTWRNKINEEQQYSHVPIPFQSIRTYLTCMDLAIHPHFSMFINTIGVDVLTFENFIIYSTNLCEMQTIQCCKI